MAIVPSRVFNGIEPDDGAPSVQFHYRTFNPNPKFLLQNNLNMTDYLA
jgi:hypothetical protein